MNTQNIFVYGLLQSNYDNEAAKMLRQHATLIGPASIPGAVFDLGDYPAAFFEKNMKGIVSGELYYIHGDSKQLLKFLDEFEGIGPDEEHPLEYHRGFVLAQCEGGEKPALCYLYNRAITHILNGDGLKHVLEELLPGQIPGEFLTMRECLMDGPVSDGTNEDLSLFFEHRTLFLQELDEGEYDKSSRSEFQKMRQIQKKSVICLWFERDVFCQVNLWFVAWVIKQYVKQAHVYLVEPGLKSPYAFNGLKATDLHDVFEHRIRLNPEQLSTFAMLWEHYVAGNRVGLKQGALDLSESFPFIPEAVQAHLDREAKGSSLGRPMDTLRKIISELGLEQDAGQGAWQSSEQGSKSISKNFGPIFQEFCRREAIYGYGDLQVLRMVEQLQKDL
jgi:gamma-glutamylcyclotransferase (GGCT)/AIG2-like uncharacterized protein YtfP